MLSGDTDSIQGKQGPFYNTLSELAKHFCRIDVLTPKVSHVSVHQLFENVFLHASPLPKWRHPHYIATYGAKLHQQHHYDLMTSHDFGLLYIGWGAYRLYRQCKIPWVSEIHHIPGIPKVATLRDVLDQKLLFYYLKKVTPFVSGFRVVNETQVPTVLQKLAVPQEKILVLYSAYLDLETFQPRNSEKQYDLVYCGRLVSNKGLFLLLQSLVLLKEQFPQIKLAIIGEGPLKQKLQKKIRQWNLEKHVVWLGWLPTSEDLAKVYRVSRLLVCPSFHEGGPRVTLEALACGIPVVCTRVGIMNEILQEGQNGYFSDWSASDIAQKIAQVLNSRNDWETFCRQSVIHLEKQSIITQYAQGLLNAAQSR